MQYLTDLKTEIENSNDSKKLEKFISDMRKEIQKETDNPNQKIRFKHCSLYSSFGVFLDAFWYYDNLTEQKKFLFNRLEKINQY